MNNSSLSIATSSARKPVAKKPVKHARRLTAAKSYSPEVQEIVRLARKLKGAFGPA